MAGQATVSAVVVEGEVKAPALLAVRLRRKISPRGSPAD